MIGQGQILASPMTMATVMASVVAGHTVVPQLITSVDPADHLAEPLTAQQDATLKQLLRGVVTSGTGIGLADVPGPPVIAKTGTAEFDRNGRTADPRLDDRRAGRPGRLRVRRRRADRRRHCRPAARAVPAGCAGALTPAGWRRTSSHSTHDEPALLALE